MSVSLPGRKYVNICLVCLINLTEITFEEKTTEDIVESLKPSGIDETFLTVLGVCLSGCAVERFQNLQLWPLHRHRS